MADRRVVFKSSSTGGVCREGVWKGRHIPVSDTKQHFRGWGMGYAAGRDSANPTRGTDDQGEGEAGRRGAVLVLVPVGLDSALLV